MNKNLFLFLIFCFSFSTPVWALRPIVHYHDLIAGEPDAGYRNGSFESAQFNGPQGLAFNKDGTRLFVADQNNNCIRVIFRDQNNRVETLTGSPQAGDANGSLQNAAFNAPGALAYIGKDRLVVYDSGNHRLRLIDLNQGRVSDLAGNGKQAETDGKDSQASLGEVWNILFLPSDNSIYFSEPHSGRLRKLDLTTGLVSTLLLNDPQIPNPGSLCLYQNALCVTDWQTSAAFQVDFKTHSFQPLGNFDVSSKTHATVLAAASSGKYLYGFRQGTLNSWVRLPDNRQIQLFSVWSNEITPDKFLDFPGEEAVAFIPDPREEMKFFLTSGSMPYVMSLKDYNFSVQDPGKMNPEKISDFDYPFQKPAHTYRILVVGNSLSYSFAGGDYTRSTFRRSLNFPKQLELILNTRAAVENAPLNYEVLDIGHGEGEMSLSSYFWPYYEVPGLVKKYDIDLVLYIVSTFRTDSYGAYFQQPLSKEGLPPEKLDSEYMLKPWDQKIPPGTPRDFFEKCLDHHWVKPASDSALKFEDTDKTLTDPAMREDVVELLSRPIKGLSDQLKTLKNSANQPVRRQMLLIYRGDTRGSLELYHDFWQRMAQKDEFPLLDMVGDFLALKPTYEDMFSYTDFHYNADGMRLYAYLVSQELISHHLIPFY